MKKKFFSVTIMSLALMSFSITGASAATFGDSINYAKSTEVVELKYNGYIQFKPNHKFEGGNVKRAYFNYTRDGESVSGGRVYTSTAYTKSDSSTYSASKSIWDSMVPWAPKTKFSYGWIKF